MSNRLYMTPAELAIQDRIDADAKANIDPYGDANESVLDAETLAEIAADAAPPPAPETPEAIVAREAAEKDAADKLAAEQAAAAVAAASAPAEAPAAPVVEAPAPSPAVALGKDGTPVDLSDLEHLRLAQVPAIDATAYETKRTEIQTKIDEIDSQWEDGTITPEARRAALAPLRTELDRASTQHAADIGEYNATGRFNQQTIQVVLDRIRAAGARDGLDYSKPAQQQQFDMASQAIDADPKNAGLSWVRKAALADTTVRAMNGIAVKAPAAAPTPPAAPAAAPAAAKAPTPPAPRPAPPAPPATLRDLPVAARSSEAGETVSARIANADANQRDAIWKGLSLAQRARMLDE